MTRPTSFAGLAALLLAAPLQGQTPGRDAAVVEIPASTRAIALGHAFQAAPDADGVFYNPALASRARGFALGVHWLTSAARAFTVSAATPWYGGGVAVGLQAIEYGLPPAGDARIGGLDRVLRDGPTAVSELAATVAYGRVIWGLQVGVAGKLLDQRTGAVRRQHLAADLGVARSLGPGTVALGVRNLGEAEGDAPGGWSPPTEVTIGWSAYGRPVGPLDLGLASQITRRDDGEWVYGGGVEFGYWPVQGRTFVARIGARNVPEGAASPVTFGGSFWGDALIVDYAFQPMDRGDGLHRFTLGWR